jgi:predicted metalloprotease with PDZ domain
MVRLRKTLIVRATFPCVLVLILSAASFASEAVRPLQAINYTLSMSRPVSHLFEVRIEVRLAKGANESYLDFQMPKWSPGRYAVFDFAKNVQEFQLAEKLPPPQEARCREATGAQITRMDAQTWRVLTCGANNFTVRYKVYGDDLSGTFSQLDDRHAMFNGGSVFMYVVGHKQDPVSLHIEPPANWCIVNSRMTSADQRDWGFANYDIMIDTPTEIAPNLTLDEFKVDGKTYRVMVHSFGDEGGRRAALVRDIERIVRAETIMWGAPEFDSYTFLIHFANDGRSGDGMEHLTSTNIIEPGALADAGTYDGALDTVAHEFFHVWNVKRLRPIELGPWDFTRPVATRSLWIAEGLTNYYGRLMERRARLWDDAKYLRTLGRVITGVENTPGRLLMSAEEASLVAPFLDRGTSVQRTNLANTAISYYPKGEVLGLVLDLLIRGRTQGRASLDDVMRRMYSKFYLESSNATYYLKGRGYTPEDFARTASEVAGFDLSDFFRRYVQGVETPPYDEALAAMGLRLVREPSTARGAYGLGITLDFADSQSSGSARIGNVVNNSVGEDAGLKRGDVILKINNTNVTRETWDKTLSAFKQGGRLSLNVRRDRQTFERTVTLGAPERYEYRVEERPDATPDQRALRSAWLNGPARS